MSNIEELNSKEKTFLAGCIESLLLADGRIAEDELKDLGILIKEHFADFDNHLAEFDETIMDEEGFWEMAESITDSTHQDAILEVLHELSVQDGLVSKAETRIINKLSKIWNK
jgi:hypothetical protein